MKLLITGGAGFIGSALIRHVITNTDHSVVNLDKLTYAGNLESLKSVEANPRYQFVQADICDADTKIPGVNQIYHLASPASPNIHCAKSYHNLPFEDKPGTHHFHWSR